MVEVADLRVGQALPEHLGQEHQMVVVNPDDVIGPGHLHHGIAELLVYPLVDVPCLLVVVCVVIEVVEERPERVIAEPVIVVFDVVRGEEDRVALFPLERLDDPVFLLFLLSLNVHTRPADPEALVGFIKRADSGGKTADTPLQAEVAVLAGDADRKPV